MNIRMGASLFSNPLESLLSPRQGRVIPVTGQLSIAAVTTLAAAIVLLAVMKKKKVL